MGDPRKQRLTLEKVASEQYSAEKRGHDGGELLDVPGAEDSSVGADYSTTGLFRDDNFSRDSCGEGDARAADRSWDAGVTRPADLYRDTAESEFTIKNAEGLDEAGPPQGGEEEEAESGLASSILRAKSKRSPMHRRTVVK